MMTPQEDWVALTHLTEEEAKMLLRMAVAQFRIIKGTVANPMDQYGFSAEGHAIAAGTSFGFLVTWEEAFKQRKK